MLLPGQPELEPIIVEYIFSKKIKTTELERNSVFVKLKSNYLSRQQPWDFTVEHSVTKILHNTETKKDPTQTKFQFETAIGLVSIFNKEYRRLQLALKHISCLHCLWFINPFVIN